MTDLNLHLNPIALRNAKTVCNFGLSECIGLKTCNLGLSESNRVKKPILYGIVGGKLADSTSSERYMYNAKSNY